MSAIVRSVVDRIVIILASDYDTSGFQSIEIYRSDRNHAAEQVFQSTDF
ncbi:MAG: hypothetical protein PHG19_01180 [Anaerotignum sp.]|nr:hypothetical protein [Anaerotignum sp.]